MRLTVAEVRARLEAGATSIEALVAPVDATQARWKPAPDRWSVVEVVNHLADEEIEDFRMRLSLVLEDPARPWPPIDPPRAAVERRYNERDLAESLERFQRERARSLDWLAGLVAPDWTRAHEHPSVGRLTAGSLAASWVVHDLLHVRQLAKLNYDYVRMMAAGHEVEYAGGW